MGLLCLQRSNADIWNAERSELLAANSRLHEERMELRSALEEERARFAEVTAMKDSLRPELARMRSELGQATGTRILSERSSVDACNVWRTRSGGGVQREYSQALAARGA